MSSFALDEIKDALEAGRCRFFLELFSEEIPARMQARGADDLARLLTEALSGLSPTAIRTWSGPRRIAIAAEINGNVAAVSATERGPRTSAPEQALQGFLRKHNASKDQVRQEGDYWVLEKRVEAAPAATLIAAAMPGVLRRIPWPKSMRWGGTSQFTWVRPLRRIVCLLDGAVVPFDLREGADDGHGLASGDLTEGHRFHAPALSPSPPPPTGPPNCAIATCSSTPPNRKRFIAEGLARIAAEKSSAIVDDPGLMEEVAGLVEFPVPLAGRIAAEHMDLPPEVMQVSMRVNQRYFAARQRMEKPRRGLFSSPISQADRRRRDDRGRQRTRAPRPFRRRAAFLGPGPQGAAGRPGAALDHVTYHAKLGSPGGARGPSVPPRRTIAPLLNAGEALAHARRNWPKPISSPEWSASSRNCKASWVVTTPCMIGEEPDVADAIRDHYAPAGPSTGAHRAGLHRRRAGRQAGPTGGFFAIDERPTGAGDPYALRRAALGVIRMIAVDIAVLRRVSCRRPCRSVKLLAPSVMLVRPSVTRPWRAPIAFDLLSRLPRRTPAGATARRGRAPRRAGRRVRGGRRRRHHRLLRRTEAVSDLLGRDDGANLLAAYRRAANILRIEERKDGPHTDARSGAV